MINGIQTLSRACSSLVFVLSLSICQWEGHGWTDVFGKSPYFVQSLSMSRFCPFFVQYPISIFQKLKMWTLNTFFKVQGFPIGSGFIMTWDSQRTIDFRPIWIEIEIALLLHTQTNIITAALVFSLTWGRAVIFIACSWVGGWSRTISAAVLRSNLWSCASLATWAAWLGTWAPRSPCAPCAGDCGELRVTNLLVKS